MTDSFRTSGLHEPAPWFRDYLAGELDRELRRGRSARRVRLAAALLLALGIGATGGIASAQIGQTTQRDSLLQAAQADASLVALRLELARTELAEARKQVAAGARGGEVVVAAELAARAMEAEAARVALNMEEIKASSLPPRDELNAPLVGGRDFVSDRIQLRLMIAQRELQAAELLHAEMERRVRAGVVAEVAALESSLDVVKKRRDLAVLAERLAMRKEFVEKATPVSELTRRLDRTVTEREVAVAQRALDVATSRLSIMEGRKAIGIVGEVDVLRARLDVHERRLELAVLLERLRQR